MQNRNGKYEKVLLGIAAVIALGVASYLIWTSQSFGEKLTRLNSSSKNDPGQPPTAIVKATIQLLSEKALWVSPVKKGKPVPLNKSILLVKKGDELFDLQLEQPQLRPPMTNKYLMENELPHILSPNVGDLDADGDGFSNLEEFNKNTSPRDPKEHPPFTDKLVLKRRITYDYILKLNSSSSPFQIRRLIPEPARSVFVTPGADFGFDRGVERFKAVSFEAKTVADPTVGEKDVSELTVADKATGKEFKLIRNEDMNLAEYEAEFEFILGDRPTRTVKKGDTFQIPGIGSTYRLLEIEETSAVIQPVDGGEPITINRG
jgi:hypothetical protein